MHQDRRHTGRMVEWNTFYQPCSILISIDNTLKLILKHYKFDISLYNGHSAWHTPPSYYFGTIILLYARRSNSRSCRPLINYNIIDHWLGHAQKPFSGSVNYTVNPVCMAGGIHFHNVQISRQCGIAKWLYQVIGSWNKAFSWLVQFRNKVGVLRSTVKQWHLHIYSLGILLLCISVYMMVLSRRHRLAETVVT